MTAMAIGGSTYTDSDGHIGRHQITEKGQDYVRFSIHCGQCMALIFDFVHLQKTLTYSDRLLPIPPPDPPYGAQSWFKPFFRIVCEQGKHVMVPVKEGEDRNMTCKSEPLTHSQFRAWKESDV
jgi:hypothetical protein